MSFNGSRTIDQFYLSTDEHAFIVTFSFSRKIRPAGWEALGVAGQRPSHAKSEQRIDYVFVARTGPAKFISQTVLTGLRSDHRPVIARIALD